MAISFSAHANGRINYGSNTILDNLPNAGGFTFACWARLTGTPATRYLGVKGSTTVGWRVSTTNTRLLRITGDYNTTEAQATVNSVFTDGVWKFIAATWDGGTTNAPKLYIGDLTTLIVEGSYDSQTVAVGTYNSDAASNLFYGGISTSNAWPGELGPAYLFDAPLSLGLIQKLQWGAIITDAPGNLIWSVLPGLHGLSVHPDLSGNANHGTITDGDLAADPPIPINYAIMGLGYADNTVAAASISKSGEIAPAGSLNLQPRLTPAAGITPTSSLANVVNNGEISLAGAITPDGDLVDLGVGIDDWGATITPAATVANEITVFPINDEGEPLESILELAGSLSIQARKPLGGSITPTSTLSLPTERSDFAGAITPTSSLATSVITDGSGGYSKRRRKFFFFLTDDD